MNLQREATRESREQALESRRREAQAQMEAVGDA
jgi:hypothetical protein